MRSIFKSFNSLMALVFLTGFFTVTNAQAAAGYFYELKIYHLKTQAQQDRMDAYLKDAYLPALHRMDIKKVGVFKPVEADTAFGKRIYVLIACKNLAQLQNIDQKLAADQQYAADGKDYIDINYKDPLYSRLEIILLSAFPKMPEPAVPNLTANKTDRVYELRSYESPSEKYNGNKVNMFNLGDEVGLFKRLGFNAVFYANVIAGSHMPNLMYMTTFNSKDDREQHWKAFGSDPYWKSLSAKPEYQNNVSHIDIMFLHPTAYSDF